VLPTVNFPDGFPARFCNEAEAFIRHISAGLDRNAVADLARQLTKSVCLVAAFLIWRDRNARAPEDGHALEPVELP
jgi:hypothetical protein